MTQSIISFTKANIFQGDNLVLKDVNLEIYKGEFHYMIGKTGSGKSSLLKTMYGEVPLIEGNGSIAGYDLRKLTRSQIPYLRRKIGIVFQDFQLLTDRNIYKNLYFVLKATGWTSKGDIKHRIITVLEKVGLTNKDYKMPHQLSGGEQQRVVVARALLNNPEILLADEPTGNLDPDASDDIMKLLHQISKEGTSILMATHDYRLIEKFPSTVFKIEDYHINSQATF